MILRGLMLALVLPALLGLGARASYAKPFRQTSTIEVSRPGSKARPRVVVASRPDKVPRPKLVRKAGKVPRLATRIRHRRPARTVPLVVVDAGHGGRDVGAVGPSGTLEKTVVLATAQELGRQLRATKRYRVVFTRNSDMFVPLRNRVQIAVAGGAALMISIHADASTDRTARGASVYVRSAKSSGSDVIRLPAHGGSSGAIARALSQLPLPSSAGLQLALVESLDDDLTMLPDPARQGRFYVLGALGMPSVLVETGFITNRADEGLLRTSKHRALIARSIREAVDDFFASHGKPPASRT